MHRYVRLLVLFLCLSGGVAKAWSQDFATQAEAKAMLEKAVAYVELHGANEAARAFMEKGGAFRDRDLYISMSRVDDGIRLSHADPRMVGCSIFQILDADGKPYGDMIRKIALSSGSGSLEYRIINPLTGTPMRKTSLIRRVDDVILVVGAYYR